MSAPFVLALLVFSFQAEDTARVKEQIQNLDDDSFEVREAAEKAVVALGPVAIPYLRAVIADAEKHEGKVELKIRATSALRGIEFAEKAKQYYFEPKRMTLRVVDAELGTVLSELEKQSGARIHADAINLKSKVTISAEQAPLFKVLDELCRGQEERSYEVRDDKITFSRSRFVACPSAYEGPFRFRVVRLEHLRSTDFRTTEGQVQLAVEADWQRYLKPSRRIDLVISRATDDKGATLEAARFGADDGDDNQAVAGRFRILAGQAEAGDSQPTQVFTLKGLSAGATRISLRGAARFSFPLEKTDVVFDPPASSEPHREGSLSISLKNHGAAQVWRLTLTHIQGRPPVDSQGLDARIDRESFIAVDDTGKEHAAVLHDSLEGEKRTLLRGAEPPEGSPLAIYQVVFPTLENRAVRRIRFKFVSEVFVKSVPVALDGIPLP